VQADNATMPLFVPLSCSQISNFPSSCTMKDFLIVLAPVALATAAAEATEGRPKSTLVIERRFETGVSPRHTAAPLLGVRSDNLFGRQLVDQSTCGYYSG
jgi:hypothetical protein